MLLKLHISIETLHRVHKLHINSDKICKNLQVPNECLTTDKGVYALQGHIFFSVFVKEKSNYYSIIKTLEQCESKSGHAGIDLEDTKHMSSMAFKGVKRSCHKLIKKKTAPSKWNRVL